MQISMREGMDTVKSSMRESMDTVKSSMRDSMDTVMVGMKKVQGLMLSYPSYYYVSSLGKCRGLCCCEGVPVEVLLCPGQAEGKAG